ncbi:MAG: hypothetical protein JXA41_03025 [Deltaproteobacteria bacterium]|nr:hypothetical protein [Deltaproteobacteria bacterium]
MNACKIPQLKIIIESAINYLLNNDAKDVASDIRKSKIDGFDKLCKIKK